MAGSVGSDMVKCLFSMLATFFLVFAVPVEVHDSTLLLPGHQVFLGIENKFCDAVEHL